MGRNTKLGRMYDHRWAVTSRNFRKEHPLCANCLAVGRPVSSQCVDHIVPHKGCRTLFWNEDNWQALCNDCHQAKSWLESRYMLTDWTPRVGLTVTDNHSVRHDVQLAGLRLLPANVPWIEAKLRQQGQCIVYVSGSVSAWQVARRLKARLVLAPTTDGVRPSPAKVAAYPTS